MWLAQGLQRGGQAWEHAGGVAVGCHGLCGVDRIVLRGPADAAAALASEAIGALGPSFEVIGDPPLIASLLGRLGWLEPYSFFAWMDSTRRPRHERLHSVRWLAQREWKAAQEVLVAASPSYYARPGQPGIRRWAGITDAHGRLTCTVAEAWSVPGLGFMTALAVLPRARCVGQGKDVCAFVLEALLDAQGRVALMEWDWNWAAVNLYTQLGMSYQRQQIVRMKQGSRE